MIRIFIVIVVMPTEGKGWFSYHNNPSHWDSLEWFDVSKPSDIDYNKYK